MRAKMENGVLSLEGQDFGKVPEEVWGSDEYEYGYDFDAYNTGLLMKCMGGQKELSDDEEKLQLLKNWLSGDTTEIRLRDLCSEKGIKYKFWSYSS